MTGNLPILYVEDDPNDVFFLRNAFEAAEIRNPLQVAHDGQEAIEYLSGSGEFADRVRFPEPCLMLLDLKLPRQTGMQVLAWLRARSPLPHLPVIVFSSSARFEDIERAYELGTNSFVVKPSSLDDRVLLAKSIKDFWLRFTEAPLHCPQAAA